MSSPKKKRIKQLTLNFGTPVEPTPSTSRNDDANLSVETDILPLQTQCDISIGVDPTSIPSEHSSSTCGDSSGDAPRATSKPSADPDPMHNAAFVKFKESGRGRSLIKCQICIRQIQAVHRACYRGRIPPICTNKGVIPRKEYLLAHLNSTMHLEAKKADQLSQIPKEQQSFSGAIEQAISNANRERATKIGSLMLTVYNDAKRGTLSAWSWPSRHVANHIAQQFDATKEFEVATVTPDVVKYVTPTNHGDLLNTIVSADMVNLKKEISSAMAISLRVDGSVDRMQIDNIHVMVKIVSKDGEEKLLFLGFDEPEERGAEGYLGAVISAIRRSGLDPNEVLQSLSSIVTDGEAMNTGHKKGLWALLDKHRMENGDPPLLKIWCAVHRSNLMWKSVVQCSLLKK
jgi:hypothetical protein